MKRKNRFILTAVLILMAFAVMPVSAFADSGLTMKLPVETKVEGGFPQEPEVFSIILKAETANAPMPEGSVGGICTFSSKGAQKQTVSIDFSDLGVYKYSVYQKAGTNKQCHYDAAVYTVTVSVVIADDVPVINVAINRGSSADKCREIIFTNKYDYPPSNPPIDKPPKTGDESSTGIWAVLMCASAVSAAFTAAKRKHGNNA